VQRIWAIAIGANGILGFGTAFDNGPLKKIRNKHLLRVRESISDKAQHVWGSFEKRKGLVKADCERVGERGSGV